MSDQRSPASNHVIAPEKRCSACGELKGTRCFTRANHHRDGLTSACKECMNKRQRESGYARRYYETHAEQISLARKRYYAEHRQEILDAAREAGRIYRAAHALEIKERRRARRLAMGIVPRLPPPPEGMKRCGPCQVVKYQSEFNKNSAAHDGFNSACRACASAAKRTARLKNPDLSRAQDRAKYQRNKSTHLAHARQYRAAHLSEERDRQFRRYFGITLADYDALLVEQDGLCAICRSPPKKRRLSVDHDHRTGAVRGLLCGNCNTAIGHLRDDPELLLRAVRYLEFHKEKKDADSA